MMLIHNSPLVRSWFNAAVRQSSPRTRICNVGAAKHRPESYRRPLGRGLIHIIAVFDTAVKCVTMRPANDPAHRKAFTWLTDVSDERILQLAMMCDAADECFGPLRFVDNPTQSIAELNSVLATFLRCICHMFVHGRCTTTTGFTRCVLRALGRPRVWIAKGRTFSLGSAGGPDRAVVERCLARMRTWCYLVKETVLAEFPSHELLNAFECFDVTAPRVRDEIPTEPLRRLSIAYKIDEDRLCKQFHDVEPTAYHIAQSTRCSSTDAWATALQKLQDRRMVNVRPTDAIGTAVAEMCVYSRAVTSSVEQSFSRTAWAFTDRSGRATPMVEEACHRIGLTLSEGSCDPADIATMAQRTWFESFHECRTRLTPRIDRGVKRKMNDMTSEAGFLRRRRHCVQKGAGRTTPTATEAMQSFDKHRLDAWTPKHGTELAFQKKTACQASRSIPGRHSPSGREDPNAGNGGC